VNVGGRAEPESPVYVDLSLPPAVNPGIGSYPASVYSPAFAEYDRGPFADYIDVFG
jgi:hypothetical protein